MKFPSLWREFDALGQTDAESTQMKSKKGTDLLEATLATEWRSFLLTSTASFAHLASHALASHRCSLCPPSVMYGEKKPCTK